MEEDERVFSGVNRNLVKDARVIAVQGLPFGRGLHGIVRFLRGNNRAAGGEGVPCLSMEIGFWEAAPAAAAEAVTRPAASRMTARRFVGFMCSPHSEKTRSYARSVYPWKFAVFCSARPTRLDWS